MITNIALLIAGVAGSGVVSFFLTAVMVETGTLGSCFDGGCGYAAVFLAFPVAWFFLFALYVMALLIWRRRPFRDRESGV